jgi:hypothetical protein
VKRLCLVLGMAVMVLPSLTAARVQAEMIPWTESVTLVGPNLSADGSAHVFSQNLGSNAQIVLSPGPTTSGVTFGRLINLANINASPASTGATAQFGGSSGNYSLKFTLTDTASGASGSLIFGGNLNGSIAKGNGVEFIEDRTTTPTIQTLKLGRNLYSVAFPEFTPNSLGNGPPIIDETGHLFTSINSETLGVAPQPSSLLLACLGLAPLGLARWFRRRKAVGSDASNA